MPKGGGVPGSRGGGYTARMRHTLGTAALVAGLVSLVVSAALWAAPSAGLAQDGHHDAKGGLTAHAARTWERSCSSCHTAPDVAFETDRAFLAQITETS